MNNPVLQKLKSHICNMQEQRCLHAIKACKGEYRDTAPYILTLSTKWGTLVRFTPQLLYPKGNESAGHIEQHVGWTPKLG